MVDALYAPRELDKLLDVDAYTGNAGKFLKVDTTETGTDWGTPTTGGDTVFTNWKSIYDATLTSPYVASGSKVETTLASGISSGQTTATLTDASSFAALQDMAIPGAGVAGAELIVNISDITGSVATFSPATSTTVSSGITVYHDDTRAVQAFLNSGELNLYIHGSFVLSGEITETEAAQVVLGGNLFTFPSFESSAVTGAVFIQRSLTANTFNITATSVKMGGLSVETSGTATAGAHFVIGESTAGQDASFINLSHCRSRFAYIGILGQNGYDWHIDHWEITHPVKHGIKIQSASGFGYGGHAFNDIHGWETSGNADSYIYITGSDHNEWTHIRAEGFGTTLHIDASFRAVGRQIFTDLYMDNNKGTAILIEKASSHAITGPRLTKIGGFQWSSTADIFVSIGANVDGTVLNGIYPTGNWGAGVEDGGNRTCITDVNVGLDSGNLTTYDGITLKSTSTGARITGCTSTRRRYGLVVESGASDFNIVGNNFIGNNTGASSLFSGARGSGTIANNEGIIDYETSVGSAPDFIGQEALVGTTWYKASATSVAGDWEALN